MRISRHKMRIFLRSAEYPPVQMPGPVWAHAHRGDQHLRLDSHHLQGKEAREKPVRDISRISADVKAKEIEQQVLYFTFSDCVSHPKGNGVLRKNSIF
jgi:hypothetical protein